MKLKAWAFVRLPVEWLLFWDWQTSLQRYLTVIFCNASSFEVKVAFSFWFHSQRFLTSSLTVEQKEKKTCLNWQVNCHITFQILGESCCNYTVGFTFLWLQVLIRITAKWITCFNCLYYLWALMQCSIKSLCNYFEVVYIVTWISSCQSITLAVSLHDTYSYCNKM